MTRAVMDIVRFLLLEPALRDEVSAHIVAALRGLVIRFNLSPCSDGIILLVLLLLFQLLHIPRVSLLKLHDLPLQNLFLLLIVSSFPLDFDLQ